MNKVEERYYFSERTERIRQDIIARSDADRIRNGLFTRPEDDGKIRLPMYLNAIPTSHT